FQYVVDQQHVTTGDIIVDVAQDADLPARRPGAIAGDEDELDLRRQAGIVHGADEVGGEDEGSFEDRDDQKVVIVAARYVLGKFQIAPRDGGRAEQDFDFLFPHARHRNGSRLVFGELHADFLHASLI